MAEISSYVQSADHDGIFNIPLWPGQRSLLDAYWQALALGDNRAVWCIGRRSGKTTLAALIAIHSCLLRPDLDALNGIAGQSQAIVVAPNQKQARLVVSIARDLVRRSSLLSPLMADEGTMDELRFINGTIMVAFPASGRGGRGYPARCLIFDEAAQFFDNDSGAAHEIEAISRAFMPMTLQFQGKAPVIICSTPYGDANWFGGRVMKAEKGELQKTRLFKATTPDMNPTISQEELDALEAEDPEGFRGEILAELIGSGGAFIEPELIDECVAARDELPPEACDHWIAGIDPAFTKDPFALVIVGRDRENRDRLRVGCVRTWVPPKRKPETPEERRALEDRVLSEVCDVMVRYRVRAVVHDQHQATIVAEAIRRRGLWPEEFNLSSGSKLDVFQNLKARVVSRTVELFEHELLIAELKRVRAKTTASGRQIETPNLSGTHCDTSIGLALAVGYIDRDGAPGTADPFVLTNPERTITQPSFAAKSPLSVANMRF